MNIKFTEFPKYTVSFSSFFTLESLENMSHSICPYKFCLITGSIKPELEVSEYGLQITIIQKLYTLITGRTNRNGV